MTAIALEEKIEKVIAQKIRPVLQADYGDITFREVTSDGFVKVQLTGACATCPGAENTISELIADELILACPEVRGVVQIHHVSDELIDEARKILRKGKRVIVSNSR